MQKINLQKNSGFTHQNFQKKISGGFTIIETMIAVALFLIVVTIGIGSLLNTTLLQGKSQDMRSIMDNLSFIMEDMSRNIRTGSNYSSSDGTQISFTSFDDIPYAYNIGLSRLDKSIDGGDWIQLNSSEISFESGSGFTVVGTTIDDNLQPFVTIRLVGKITSKGVVTPFSLQTSVSQRLVDI